MLRSALLLAGLGAALAFTKDYSGYQVSSKE